MTKSGASKLTVVFRLSHMGDVALTTGVLSHWHEKRGDRFIFITRAGSAPLLENHPAVAEIIRLDDAVLKGMDWFKEARRLAAQYKDNRLIDLHGTLRSRILSLVWKGEVRRYPKFGIVRRLYDRTHAERYRKILEATNVTQRYAMALGGKPPAAGHLTPRIHLTDAERDEAKMLLDNITNGRPLIAIHPYATHPAKQWPREHWLTLTSLLASAGMDWFVIGHDDTPLLPGHDREFTNVTNLRDTCALLAEADMLVTADSGPMHLASGVGTLVTALFGPTAKVWGFYPAGPQDTVLELDMDCRPCSLHGGRTCEKGYECLASQTPEMVMEVITRRFAE
ncbi:glycosyltransferase family 9 protein [uncultured Pseudodesulfovibrio sp.]|uniref:glycosyltransferase family 9 protein n=1 Tax=uncultured Pseudodesulfovibrio sp. TaxID=2035858 RepID=UPI0029C91500|nr:glycosyltransferase family 9 protein [uncultured Pseudodesulfovibrio sp.]